MIVDEKERRIGYWYAFGAFTLWGFLPAYWKALGAVNPGEILVHRIIWSCVFVFAILYYYKRWEQLKGVLQNGKKLFFVFVGAMLISINWFTFIWAVNNNYLIQTSLGYYINPLFSVLVAIVFLKERLNFWQSIALALATVGVLIITLHYGEVPWIALSLAISFTFYGLIKKMVNVDSIVSLALETLMLTPFALAYLFIVHSQGGGALGGVDWGINLLLVLSGIATALPLLWFALGAQRIPMSTLGFIQYLGPSISLVLGVLVYKESFTTIHFLSFSLIWAALILYTLSNSSFLVNAQPKMFKASSANEGLSR